MTVDLIIGTLTPISSNFINPYTGEILSVNGTYYLNDTLVTGGPGTNDIALGVTFDQFWRLEDELGNLLIENIEVFLPAPGDDILLLSSDTHILGDLIIQTAEGNDVVWSNAGNDLIEGGLGDDILHGGPGHDTINGQDDNDDIFGASGNDILSGGIGTDQLSGGTGDDTYVYNTGDGNDTITETSGFDTISLGVGITLGDITFVQNGNDLEIMIADGLTVKDFYSGDPDKIVEQIVFNDTSTYDLVSLLEPTPVVPLINSVAEAETLSDPATLLNGLDEITVLVTVDASQIGTDRGIFDTESSDNKDDALTLRYDKSGYFGGGTNVIKVGLQTTEGQIGVESSSNVQTTDVQHIAVTWRSGEALKLYINGVEDTTTYNTGPIGGNIAGIQDLFLGVGAKNAGGWSGSIDDFKVFDVALDASAINDFVTSWGDNRVPDAFDDEFSGNQDMDIIGNVLNDNGYGADSDPDGDILSILDGTFSTNNGSVTISTTGEFTYTPDIGFSGVDTFIYTLSDGVGGISTANVSFIVGVALNDTFIGSSVAEHFDGGFGIDTVDYSSSVFRVTLDLLSGEGWAGNAYGDTYESIENVIGTDISTTGDFIFGNDSNNQIWGLGGNDVLQGRVGADTLYGGGGNDYSSYTDSQEAVNINMETNINSGGDAEGDVFYSIENIIGSGYDDIIVGNEYNNTLRGGSGADILAGGLGKDLLYGNDGQDIFLFEATSAFVIEDAVMDLDLNEDSIDISDLLSDYDPLTDAISDFVQIENNGYGSNLSVNSDGEGDDFINIAYIADVINIEFVDTLEDNGVLITF